MDISSRMSIVALGDKMKDSPSKKKGIVVSSARPLRLATDLPIREQEIQIRVNHYPVTLKGNFPKTIYHYDVVFQNVVEPGKKDAKGAAPPPRTSYSLATASKKPDQGAGEPVDQAKTETSLPDRMLPAIWRKFEKVCKDTLKFPTAFDGKKNVYTATRLPFTNGEAFTASFKMLDPDDPDKERHFRVTVKLAATVCTDSVSEFLRSGMDRGCAVVQPQDVIQGLDVALRHAPSVNYIPVNRSFFNMNIARHDLDAQLELLYGHYQSLCLGSMDSVTLNIDLATKAFYKEMPLIDYLRIALRLKPEDSFDLKVWNDASLKKATEAVDGRLIKYGTGPKIKGVYQNYHKFTANGIIDTNATKFLFSPAPGLPKISIQEYMEKIKSTKILHPEFPVVHIGKKTMTNYVPLELCSIITQPYRGKMENALTKVMIKGAAIKPIERFSKINESRRGCFFEACEVLRSFGIEVGKETITTKAYSLKPPKINVGENGRAVPAMVDQKEGKWGFKDKNRNIPSKHYVEAANVPKFIVLDATNKILDICQQKFINDLTKAGEEHGMKKFCSRMKECQYLKLTTFGAKPDTRKMKDSEVIEVLARAFRQMKVKGFELVIVIISDDGKEYPFVKTAAEIKVGILTACIKEKNVFKPQPQTLFNYLLKLNAKLNGINFTVKNVDDYFKTNAVLILGADVTHPSPNSNTPSVAAVCGSFNLSGMGYSVHIQQQDARQEIIMNMDVILEKMMRKFFVINRKWPKRIMMFRDGVSEGYFDAVKGVEYEKIREKAEELVGGKVDITFIVVKKRHHTRFQPMDKFHSVGISQNVLPGTVVDSKIVHPSEREFFLNSHVGIQGTSKPTRYHVIHDDFNMSMGELVNLTYWLCYGFVRCTQPVSYPAATYYAHLAAYRGRSLLEKEGMAANLPGLEQELNIHPDLLNRYPMFFV